MIIAVEDDGDALKHYGILRRSGRYPWGSGKDPYQRANDFIGIVSKLRKQGLSDKEIAEGFGMTTSQLRSTTTIARAAKKQGDVARAEKLKSRGWSNVAIGREMGIPESSVRNLLERSTKDKADILSATTAIVRSEVDRDKYIDIGKGVEYHMGISRQKLDAAVKVLEDEGYRVFYVPVEQLGTGKKTNMKVLAPPNSTFGEVLRNRDQIRPVMVRSVDGGRTYDGPLPPISISSKRVKVRYAEEGGTEADGVIYVRPGVKDLSLGRSRYAQVRIAVDGTHYLKGMAIYRDDLPPGVDLVFNTNKSNTGNKLDAMKPMGKDPNNPFGAFISDQVYKRNPDGTFARDKNGNRIVESAMNIVNAEGTWGEWSKSLSSQMLSKQSPTLAKRQLDIAYESKVREFEEIMSLTNPTVRRHLLEKFADGADASAVHLKAAHLPRQATKVILPVESLKDNEIYAPTYKDGERVVLIRYPHGGIFEIPELRVNNRHPEARKILGTDAPDAVGINSKVAQRLSGADFDGDTVLVIPNNHGLVKTHPALKELKGFDPQAAYPHYEGMKVMTDRQKGRLMGEVSNLITDMTIKGATFDEIARAVKHSMVVIDAPKHRLDWKRSEQENGIRALKEKYQDGGGASTIISKARSVEWVPDRKLRPESEGGAIDSKTGDLVYVPREGSTRKIKSTKLAEAKDAHELVSSSRTPIEVLYADHSNRLKDLARAARKEILRTTDIEYSPSAAKVYASEVKTLESKLNLALRNAPLERRAQVIANAEFSLVMKDNPDMDGNQIKKAKARALQNARARVGAGKELIDITPREWEAIQAGAISKTRLKQILENADVEKVKELAMPRERTVLTDAMKRRAEIMLKKHTLAEVADQLGVDVSTLRSSLAEEE